MVLHPAVIYFCKKRERMKNTMEEYRNYIQLEGKTGLFKNCVDFMYVDIPATEESTPYADRLFMIGGFDWVDFRGDFTHNDYEYIIAWCRVPIKHVEKTKQILEALKTGIPLLGYKDYQKFCEEVFMPMTESDNIREVKDYLKKEVKLCTPRGK